MHMCVYVHIYVCVHMCVHICVSIYIYVYICLVQYSLQELYKGCNVTVLLSHIMHAFTRNRVNTNMPLHSWSFYLMFIVLIVHLTLSKG